MQLHARFMLLAFLAILIATGCSADPSSQKGADPSSQTSAPADRGRDMLVGAWRSTVVFQSGALAGVKDLEFLCVYNAGGTMTESSNYDEAANSSPPAYGVWKQTGPNTYETKYMYYTTKAPGPGDGSPNGNDWWPAGRGVLTETIKLSDEGQAYASTIRLALFDRTNTPIEGGGEGMCVATRIVF